MMLFARLAARRIFSARISPSSATESQESRAVLRQANQRLIQLGVVISELVGFAGYGDQVSTQINIVVEFIGPADAEDRQVPDEAIDRALPARVNSCSPSTKSAASIACSGVAHGLHRNF